MKPEKKPAAKSAVVKSAVTTRAIERDVQRRQQAAHRMDTQRPHIPRLAAEALACDEAPAPAPTLREELNANRRREIGAPMATMIDPLDGLGNSLIDIWSRISTPLMFAVWSIGCFALGRLS